MAKNALISKHKLDFLSAYWDHPLNSEGWMLYKVGTVGGQWRCKGSNYQILSFLNEKPGSGHLDDVFEWFEFSCKRDKKNLMVMAVMNERFKNHLIEKRGFVLLKKGGTDYIKRFL